MKLNIGEDTFTVKIASTDKQRQSGLKRVNGGTIPKNAGLVLKYEEARNVPITMDGMSFPLDLVFIKNNKVVALKQAKPGDPDVDIKKDVDHVLELKMGEGGKIKIGDEVSWTGSRENGVIQMADGGIAPEGDLHLLDEDGQVQMNMKGTERIFSRIHTKQLYDLSKKGNDPNNYRAIGRAILRMLDKQNTQEEQYSDN